MLDKLAVDFLRIVPRGKVRLANLLVRIRPSLRRFPAKTRYGTIVCDITEPICTPLIFGGEYEWWKDDLAAIERIPLESNSVVLDIGANIGVTARLFARRAGWVHAFEPSPRALRLLRANALPNILVHPIALSDFDGVARFEERHDLDLSSFSDQGIVVSVRTVDSFLLQPDFIKVDVEGFEQQVLRGARETLKRSPVIMFEALDSNARQECEEIILSANRRYRFETVSDLNHIAWPE